jgi:hypothetical protein
MSSCHATFPPNRWPDLLPSSELTLNHLRPWALYPTLSAWHGLHSPPFNFAAHPIHPPGQLVIAHDSPQQRKSWARHGTRVFFISHRQLYTTDVSMSSSLFPPPPIACVKPSPTSLTRYYSLSRILAFYPLFPIPPNSSIAHSFSLPSPLAPTAATAVASPTCRFTATPPYPPLRRVPLPRVPALITALPNYSSATPPQSLFTALGHLDVVRKNLRSSKVAPFQPSLALASLFVHPPHPSGTPWTPPP